MDKSPLPVVAVAALLVLSGCSAPVATDDRGPSADEFPDVSADEFPNASAIDQSVFDRHAALLANTSFTVEFEKTGKRSEPWSSNFTYTNSSERVLVEPGAPQYLSQPNGTLNFLGTGGWQSIYSEGNGAYVLGTRDDESAVQRLDRRQADRTRTVVFNESSDRYLWQGWRKSNMGTPYHFFSENVTYERLGTETFRGVAVMRYEASGVDALNDPRWERDQNLSFTDFSTTLLVDADGVIRYFRGEVDYLLGNQTRNTTLVHTVTDVGSTDVEKPDWVSNATVES